MVHSSCEAPKTAVRVANPCGTCYRGVAANSIFCPQCKKWVHKRCSGIVGRLKEDPTFRCRACTAPALENSSEMPEVITIDGDTFESFSDFCYLSDALGQAGGIQMRSLQESGQPGKLFMTTYL